jgi:hypothetical protein
MFITEMVAETKSLSVGQFLFRIKDLSRLSGTEPHDRADAKPSSG